VHQLDEATLGVIIRTFLEVFPRTHAVLLHFNADIPVLGLVGTLEPLRVPADWLEQRAPGVDLRQALKGVGLDRALQLPGCLVAGPEALKQFAESAALNTDDNPVVTFLAPRFSYRRETQPGALLLKLIAQSRVDTGSVVLAAPGANDNAFVANLNDFIAARDLYLQGLVEEGGGRISGAIDLYLAAARRSLYFTPAYARCVTIIQVLANPDRAAARRLFERLETAQPAQPLGRQLLGPLFEPASK
jgi:spermidine synthase